MTLTELKYILALTQQKNFGRAAKVCHVSQPTLSIAINKLETELGVQLFERMPQEIQLTAIGQEIVSQAQRILEDVETLKATAQSGQSQTNTPLRLGAIYTVAPYVFPELIPHLRKIAPDMPLMIREDYTKNLSVQLQQGSLDAIFISLPFSGPGILTQTLYKEPFVVVLPKKHKLSKQEAIDERDLKDENILLLGEGHCFRDQVIAACPDCYDYKKEAEIIEGTSLDTLRHMVASGLGITILPSSATQIHYYQSSLCIKPFKGYQPEREIALAWRVSFPRTKAIDALIQALTKSQIKGSSSRA